MGARFVRRAAASLGIAVVLWSFVPIAAQATENETFGMTPYPERINSVIRRTFAVPLDRGSVFEDAVRVYNRTDQPLDLLIYASDARAALDGTISVGFRGSPATGIGSWIKLSREMVSLPRRASAIIRFRISVRSTKPSPDLGAIVAENTGRGLRAELVRRLHIVVRTAPPGSTTASMKVRAFTLRSGWTIVAVGGLIAAGVLVWLARRRARRSRDDDAAPADTKREPTDTPEASRPVLHRFGRTDTEPRLVRLGTSESDAPERRRAPRRRPVERDDRPLLDEVAFIEDEPVDDEEEYTDEVEVPPSPPRVRRAAPPKPSVRKATPPAKKKPPGDDKKLDYIPLDDL